MKKNSILVSIVSFICVFSFITLSYATNTKLVPNMSPREDVGSSDSEIQDFLDRDNNTIKQNLINEEPINTTSNSNKTVSAELSNSNHNIPVVNTNTTTKKQDFYKELSEIPPELPMIQKSFNLPHASYQTVKEYSYNIKTIYKVVVREAMASTIVLPNNEIIKRVAIGDESSFIAEQVEDNVLMIFPQKVHRDSSITIISNTKNVYSFYLKSISFEDKELPDLVIRIKNNNLTNSECDYSLKKLDTCNKDIDFLDEADLDPNKIDWNYKIKGSKSISPSRVWNDGTFTYLDFKNKKYKKDAVTAYMVKDKVDTPVNVRWNKEILIIEAVGNLSLLNGKKWVCIKWLSL